MTGSGWLAVMLAVTFALPGGAQAAPETHDTPAEVTPPSLTSPDKQKRAEDLFNRGETFYSLGRFDVALIWYKRAFEIVPYPEFVFNIGLCYRNLGEDRRAIHSFRRYLRMRPSASNRQAVEDMIAKLKKRLDVEEVRRRDLLLAKSKRKRQNRPLPIYRRWQFWTGMAAASLVGGGTYYLRSRGDGLPAADARLEFGR